MKNTITEALTEAGPEVLASIDNLPLGQKLLTLGIKPVSVKELRDHFACDQLEKELNREADYKARKERVMEKRDKRTALYERKANARAELVVARKKLSETFRRQARKDIKSTIESLEYRAKNGRDLFEWPGLSGISLMGMGLWGDFRKQVNLVFCKLDEYMEDAIPQYCINQIEEAKALGLDNFEVVYPVIEEVKQPDPVIISKLGDKMIWVTFYE